MIYGWSPQIGDPTLLGWITVANDFAALFCAAWAVRADWRNANFWLVVALIMLALGINKQLDLQGLLAAVGREIAIQDGWYNDRRVFQKWFIELGIAASLAVMAILIFVARKSGKPVLLAIVGLALIGGFVIARTASFHHMDAILGLTFLAIKVNHVIENAGVIIVSLAALLAIRASKSRLRSGRAVRGQQCA